MASSLAIDQSAGAMSGPLIAPGEAPSIPASLPAPPARTSDQQGGIMQLFDLSGRVAVVTGGNAGIGFAIAQALAQAGAAVVLAGRRAGENAAAAARLAADGAR